MKTKLKDIADKAGISVSTVSLVLSGKGRISNKTKQRVIETAKQLGYNKKNFVNPRDSMLNVALLLHIENNISLVWGLLLQIIKEIKSNAKKLGINVIIIPVSDNDTCQEIFDDLIEFSINGVIALRFAWPELFEAIQKRQIPIVIGLNNNYQLQYNSIGVDDFQGSYEAVQYLMSLGHERILYIYTHREDLPNLYSDRYFGYKKAFDEKKIAIPQAYTLYYDAENPELLKKSILAIMQEEPSQRPTAALCLDDEIGSEFHEILRKEGFNIPEDFSIISHGDMLDYTKPYTPRLCTMRVDGKTTGRLCVELLDNLMRKASSTSSVGMLKVKQVLIIRSSCGVYSGF